MRHAPQIYPGSYDGSGSSLSSFHPLSCSPQLPFAVTPSANSLASLAEHHAFVSTAPAVFHQGQVGHGNKSGCEGDTRLSVGSYS